MTFDVALSVGLSLLALVFVVSGRVAAKATRDETPPLAYAWAQRRAAVSPACSSCSWESACCCGGTSSQRG
ncbi:MAG TPA: hypothetical protein VM733_15800 [Thermoanaerobaculia bacterium]|nr:hypothetical protein [Thermoanaerobaculia bacterium]